MFIGQWGTRKHDFLTHTFLLYQNKRRYYKYKGGDMNGDGTQVTWHYNCKDSNTLNLGFKLWIEF